MYKIDMEEQTKKSTSVLIRSSIIDKPNQRSRPKADSLWIFTKGHPLNIVSLALCAMVMLELISVSSDAAMAQTPLNPDSALVIVLDNIQGTKLSLRQAEQNALKNATAVRIAEASYLAARGSVRRERGAFDPELFINFTLLDQKDPTASFFSGAPILHSKQTM